MRTWLDARGVVTAGRVPASWNGRRACLFAGAFAILGAISACQRSAPSFKGIDLTGAEFGRSFSLPDADGTPRSLADFKGRIVLLFFGFTQCPDVCPNALSRAVEVRKQLGPDGNKVQVVFITIDPERDTPQILREYTKAFDPGFVALRGDARALADTAKEFKIVYQKVSTSGTYTMDHTALTYVFDPSGRLRLALRHEQSVPDVVGDLKTLLRD